VTEDTTEVRLNEAAHRYEILVGGEHAGHAQFHDADGVRTFFHTEIDPKQEGRGLGGRLVRGALDQTRAAGLEVIPECEFVARFIEKHAEYADLVAAA
jgi:predicted GNAT family acetyltransferase